MNKEINEFKDILNGNYGDKCGLIIEYLYLNIFVCDKDIDIRCRVAIKGYYHDILQYDKNWHIRRTVAYYTKDKNILEHLCNAGDYRVSELAKERLIELTYE